MKVLLDYEIPETDFEALDKIISKGLTDIMLKHKYRTMWQLRSLENEINESGGLIIIKSSGQIALKQFPVSLSERMNEILIADLD